MATSKESKRGEENTLVYGNGLDVQVGLGLKIRREVAQRGRKVSAIYAIYDKFSVID